MKPLLTLLVLLAAPRLAAAQTYTVTDLGTLPGGTYSTASAINNLGHVTGSSDTDHPKRALIGYLEWLKNKTAASHKTASKNSTIIDSRLETKALRLRSKGQVTHAFFWDGQQMHDLGGDTMGLSEGYAINDRDAIVGKDSDGEGDAIPGYWGRQIKFPAAADYGIASAINSTGSVVGSRHDYYQQTGEHPYSSGRPLGGTKMDAGVLNLPKEDAEATGINYAGLVVGSADVSAKPGTKPRHAVLWRKGVRQDLGTLGGTESRALAVNAPGQIVGISSIAEAAADGNPLYHAFFWNAGKMTDLGTLPGDRQSGANALNARGEVVGYSGERGCLWRGGRAYDLNALLPAGSGWVLTGAAGINDRGQIVGTGLHGGKKRGYLLTPKL